MILIGGPFRQKPWKLSLGKSCLSWRQKMPIAALLFRIPFAMEGEVHMFSLTRLAFARLIDKTSVGIVYIDV
jgi:hypothetical protein